MDTSVWPKVGLLVLFATFFSVSVHAQSAAPVHQLRTAELADEGFTTSTASDLGHNRASTHLSLDYAFKPLVIEEGGQTLAVPVRHDWVGQIALAYGLWNRLVLYTRLPVHLIMKGEEEDGPGLGDVAFGARLRVLGDDQRLGLAVQVTGTAPTAEAANPSQTLLGDTKATVHPEALLSVHLGIVHLSANLGVRVRHAASFEGVSINDELTYNLAGAVDLPGHVQLWTELFGATTVQNFADREGSPLELLIGPKWIPCSGLVMGTALGLGLAPGYGTPLVRAVASVGYRPPGARCEPPPPSDTDRDGLLDEQDACPTEPEDADGFEDEDGCPEADNDRDGVLDGADACPLEPEDADGFEDEDGCPEADNDADGLDDVLDQCPNEPGVPENQGCPSLDRDGDGVADRIDNCPDEIGPPENQGCKKKQLVVIRSTQLEILERIHFVTDSATVQPRSNELLDNVAWVLQNHPELTTVRIEGHTDSNGDERYNLDLSQARADAVKAHLVGAGIDPARLATVGYGEAQPIDTNATAHGRANNRRVEFTIVDESLEYEQQAAAAGDAQAAPN